MLQPTVLAWFEIPCADLDRLHEAIDGRRVVRFAYVRPDGAESRRDAEPLLLAFWTARTFTGGSLT